MLLNNQSTLDKSQRSYQFQQLMCTFGLGEHAKQRYTMQQLWGMGRARGPRHRVHVALMTMCGPIASRLSGAVHLWPRGRCETGCATQWSKGTLAKMGHVPPVPHLASPLVKWTITSPLSQQFVFKYMCLFAILADFPLQAIFDRPVFFLQ